MLNNTESNLFSRSVVFVILTKNEENTICGIINGLRNECSALNIEKYSFITVDDSEDATSEKAREAGSLVVKGRGLGLGDAYRLGLEAALKTDCTLIVSLDGDGQVELTELAAFLKPLDNGADLVVASRFKDANHIRYSYPAINHVGSRLLSAYLSFMTGQKVTDSHGGFRIFKRAVAEKTVFWGHHTYVQETLIEAAEAGFKIFEVPSVWKIRQNGKSRVVGSVPLYVHRVGPVLLKRFIKKVFTGKSR